MIAFHRDIRDLIIKPTLTLFERGGFSFGSQASVDLVYGTALAETGLRELEQEYGPALGFWQMESKTHDDIWESYLKYQPVLRSTLIKIAGVNPDFVYNDLDDEHGHPLIYNLRYGCAMCVIHYHRYMKKFPTDLNGQAEAWVKTYNRGGKGTVEHYIEAWQNG